MENQLTQTNLKELLLKEAGANNLCDRMTQQFIEKDPLSIVRIWKLEPDWGLERRFPSLGYLEKFFNTEQIREKGIFVSQNIDNLVLEDQVYIFINCTGYATVKFNPEKAIFPMIYLSQGSKMSFIVDGSSSPFQLYDNSQVKIDVVNGGRYKIYKCESV